MRVLVLQLDLSTPLLRACVNDHLDIAKYLVLEHKVDLTYLDKVGFRCCLLTCRLDAAFMACANRLPRSLRSAVVVPVLSFVLAASWCSSLRAWVGSHALLVSATQQGGMCAVTAAASGGSVALIKFLLEDCQAPTFTDKVRTPNHFDAACLCVSLSRVAVMLRPHSVVWRLNGMRAFCVHCRRATMHCTTPSCTANKRCVPYLSPRLPFRCLGLNLSIPFVA